ncbi:MAG: T9SS C-terminal target domain-containing protein [Calditrichaeota bacterium]|nr:MAG: T9SS C-terminal target domain-containing protein [Calditrichota bacterium]MBL1205591.1 T9SS C-terminal target domain-containing protein [Calditrichota bacterium]NOG45420.1 T9SS type A sorting domain-containing protein [Calditrichota bacterium]
MKTTYTLLFILFFSFVYVQGESISVNSISELQDAIDSANPGDEIILANGTYSTNSDIKINNIHGIEDNLITIRSEDVTDAVITGNESFLIENSSYIHLTGFKIATSVVERDGLEIKASENIRLSNCVFDMQESGMKNYWLYVTDASQNIRIDHNEFEAKYDEGCFIVVYGPSNGISQYVQIDHNHFKGHYFTGSNGGEAIRFGDSNRQNYSSYSVIEDNLFENCKGDVEVISVKSTNFTVRRNTLSECNGSIVLRHGDSCLVESNFIMNGSGGIRFYGDNQKIIGNYLYNNDNLNLIGSSSSARGAIAIGGGSQDDLANGENTYDRPENCLVAYNTLAYNLGKNIDIGVFGSDSYPPKNLTIANNLVVSDVEKAVNIQKEPDGLAYLGNVLFGDGGAGDIDTSDYKWLDPDFSIDSYSVFHLNSTSPLIDSSEFVSGLDDYLFDIDGQMRSTYDVGADEYSGDIVKYRPLTSLDVGPVGNEIRCSTAVQIQDAMKTAQPGDKIVIDPGVYVGSTSTSGNSQAHFFGGNSGTAENPIYILGANLSNKPVLKGESISSKYILYITGDYWNVQGLVLREGKKGIMLDHSNHTEIFNTEVDSIGEEAIHIRDGSSYNLISNCTITETGLYTPDFGEGVYFGSDVGKWDDFVKESDYNIVEYSMIGPNVRAESVDIKEGSTGNVVRNCVFYGEGITGANYSDSFIDAKGNYSIIRDNIAYRSNNPIITDAFQVHQRAIGWGLDNAFIGNEVYLDDANAYIVDVSSGSAYVGNNTRHPEGNMYKGNYSEHDNIPPIVKMISPESGSSHESGDTIELSANALDLDGEIVKVEFYANDAKLGEAFAQPYTYVWNSVSAGDYNVYAKAFDNEFVTTSSETIIVRVDTLAGNVSKFTLNFFNVFTSSYEGNSWGANTIDGDLDTRWAADGDGEWIYYVLPEVIRISFLKIVFYNGNAQKYTFDIETSNDGLEWKSELENVESSGETNGYERFDLEDATGKYIRYTGHMNNVNSLNSLIEFEIWGAEDSTLVSIEDNLNTPKVFALHQNFPNPFNPQTKISFAIPKAADVNISVYNMAGQLIETLYDNWIETGHHTITFNAEKYASGVYFYKIQSGNNVLIRKMVLLK